MSRTTALIGALSLVAIPPLLALGEALVFYHRNASTSTIISSGVQRDYILHVPPRYDARKPAALVISMHGAGLWPAGHQRLSQWDRVADESGFLVAYPAGAAGNGPRIWAVDGTDRLRRDVRFIGEMIDTIAAHYNIDTARIYADGLSNGGGMAFALSCTMHDRIAAVGLVASAQTLPFRWCPDTRPMPMIAFHGTADPVTPYRGGATWISKRGFPDITGWVATWAARNHCAPRRPDERIVAPNVKQAVYTGCAADVVFYSIIGGGHTWPGGEALPAWFVGRTTNSVDASREMWKFYSAHPLR